MASGPPQITGSPFQALASLGSPEQTHPTSKVVQVLGWGVGFLALGFSGFCFNAAVVPLGRDAPPPLTFYLLGGAFAFAGAVLIGVTIYNRSLTFLVYREGLAYIHFGKCTFLPWQEIDCVLGGVAPGSINFAIVAKSRERIRVNYVTKHVGKLWKTLQVKMTEHLLPGAQATIDSGGQVSFGSLQVSRSGFVFKEQVLTWGEVDKIIVDFIKVGRTRQSLFEVDKKDQQLPWYAVYADTVPNFLFLINLLRRVNPASRLHISPSLDQVVSLDKLGIDSMLHQPLVK